MDVSSPTSGLLRPVESEVLTALSRTQSALTGRGVFRLVSRGSPQGVIGVLNRLAAQGIVNVKEAGSANLYSLNRDHVTMPAIRSLISFHEELLNRIRTELQPWKIPAVHASVFGSFARRDGDSTSDIDLFIVATTNTNKDSWRDQINALASNIYRWSGNHAGISDIPQTDIPNLIKKNPETTAKLKTEAITIHGPPIKKLLANA